MNESQALRERKIELVVNWPFVRLKALTFEPSLAD